MIHSRHGQKVSSISGSFSLPAICHHFPFYETTQARLRGPEPMTIGSILNVVEK